MDDRYARVLELGEIFNKKYGKDLSKLPRKYLEQELAKMHSAGKELYQLSIQMLNEFEKVKKANLDLEEKMKHLYAQLDGIRGNIKLSDYEDFNDQCKEMYGDLWNRLDDRSHGFLVTAHYLKDRCRYECLDFSPVILEFCRVFENEMLCKVFIEFVEGQAQRTEFRYPSRDAFKVIEDAVNNIKGNKNYFISSMDMVKAFEEMNNSFPEDTYETEMQHFLSEKHYDLAQISDKDGFINPAKDYVNNYRNEAAHPNHMDSAKADTCKEKTEDLVGTFINAAE